MELSVQLVPVVFAELYKELRRGCREQLEDRLADVGRDLDWLDTAIGQYEAMWTYRLGESDPEERYRPLDPDHAALASWIAAGLRGVGPSNEISQTIQQTIRNRTKSDPQPLVRSRTRIVLVAWSLGQVIGEYDHSLPVVFCEQLSDRSVQLAYEGLVHHVAALPEVDQWPEVLGSAILWRACGLADGLRPQPGRSNLAASVGALLAELKRYVSDAVLQQWRREWPGYQDVRNGLTHVSGENGKYCFEQVESRMRTREDVSLALTSATTFVGHSLATELLDSLTSRWDAVASSLEYELQAYEDLASSP